MFAIILARDHKEFWFYFKYAYLKEHISAVEKIVIWVPGYIAPETVHLWGKKQIWLTISLDGW